jgi:dihydrofolate synthase/folylpolyglutamate synthase
MDAEAAADGDETGGPTYFEVTTAMALVHFVERQVDAAVLEVGLGGRLDSPNVCLPLVSVITSISFDHMKHLGNTLAAIAREKAGIIKSGVPVICGVTQFEPQAVIAEFAREHGCRLIQLGEEFCFRYAPPKQPGQGDT